MAVSSIADLEIRDARETPSSPTRTRPGRVARRRTAASCRRDRAPASRSLRRCPRSPARTCRRARRSRDRRALRTGARSLPNRRSIGTGDPVRRDLPQLAEVVDLAVEHQLDRAVLIADRLVGGGRRSMMLRRRNPNPTRAVRSDRSRRDRVRGAAAWRSSPIARPRTPGAAVEAHFAADAAHWLVRQLPVAEKLEEHVRFDPIRVADRMAGGARHLRGAVVQVARVLLTTGVPSPSTSISSVSSSSEPAS